MPQLRQRNNEGETVNEHGPPTKKPKLNYSIEKQQKKNENIKKLKDRPIWDLKLSNLMFHELKNAIGKIAATVDYLQKERDYCCVAYQFNLSSVSYISKRPEIVYLANRQSKNYSNHKTVPDFVILYIPFL